MPKSVLEKTGYVHRRVTRQYRRQRAATFKSLKYNRERRRKRKISRELAILNVAFTHKDVCAYISTYLHTACDLIRFKRLCHTTYAVMKTPENEKRIRLLTQASFVQGTFGYIPKVDQTREICLAAVQRDGTMLTYVVDQTREICLAAVKQDGDALKYVYPEWKHVFE